MANLLIPPQLQFVDADGAPYVGGTLFTYIPGSLTRKLSYQNAAQSILQTNPIVLDARGACTVYGDGDYRLILRDVNGNQVFDLLSSEPLPASAISAAMLPVVGAITLAQARDLMGVTAAINAAVSNVALLTGPTGPVGPAGAPSTVAGPTGPTGPAGTSPSFNFSVVQSGTSTTDPSGFINVTYATPFTTAVRLVSTYQYNDTVPTFETLTTVFFVNTTTGFIAQCYYDLSNSIQAFGSINWVAIGV